MNIIDGGITAPEGFKATGQHIGIKKIKRDISMVISDVPAVVAGVFTQNIVKAAPVLWNENIVAMGKKVKGIITISGNANACTGEQGTKDNEKIAEDFAKCIDAKPNEILTAATGIIGLQMPMDIINKGIVDTVKFLSSDREEARNAATGIITTDTFIKEIAVSLNVSGKTVKIGAMAKGSGMIHPNMATVLAFITTDIKISQELLQKALTYAISETYNMISVDGATSTNDMVLVVANGKADNEEITENSEYYESFKKALLIINKKLAMDIVRDGEGANKFIETNIFGAKSSADAKPLAKSIVTNNLVKTAMYGEDANWGRVVAAMGSSGGNFDPLKVDIVFRSDAGEIKLMNMGTPVKFDEEMAARVLSLRDISIIVNLNDGNSDASAWGCDLGHEYVSINEGYRRKN